MPGEGGEGRAAPSIRTPIHEGRGDRPGFSFKKRMTGVGGGTNLRGGSELAGEGGGRKKGSATQLYFCRKGEAVSGPGPSEREKKG